MLKPKNLSLANGTPEWSLTLGPSPLIVVIASAVVDNAAVVLTSATAVLISATLLMELAPYGPLGILLVGDVNVEPLRVFKELQA